MPQGRVEANGNVLYIEGASVTQLSTGIFRVNFSNAHPDGGLYPVIFSIEQDNNRDDYSATYTNVNSTGFDVEVAEHDTGNSPSIPRNVGFSFYIPLGN